jgi:hypothetical protein
MINFRKTKSIHPCRLSREDLVVLSNLIQTDFPVSDRITDFTIETRFDNVVIAANDVQHFLSRDRLPAILTDLEISKVGWSPDRNIDKMLHLRFGNNSIDLSVSGSSESWVNGKYIQIVDFLKTKQFTLWFLHHPVPVFFLVRVAIGAYIVSEGVLLIRQFYVGGLDSIRTSTLLIVIAFGLLSLGLGKQKYTHISLVREETLLSKHKDALTFLLGFAALAYQVLTDLNR